MLRNDDPRVPLLEGPVTATSHLIPASFAKEYSWLDYIKDLLHKPELKPIDNPSWAAFHVAQQPPLERPISKVALLPLFYEQAHTV